MSIDSKKKITPQLSDVVNIFLSKQQYLTRCSKKSHHSQSIKANILETLTFEYEYN